ncbi:hypothetical protein [Methanolinea mesophila]|uniref:hypothetical protein n=1 Tax=Methanolinea mesophila TaxID=547055 RepID=UPI001AE541E6|nr:hypothetical protein [Methanolinea mesophila]
MIDVVHAITPVERHRSCLKIEIPVKNENWEQKHAHDQSDTSELTTVHFVRDERDKKQAIGYFRYSCHTEDKGSEEEIAVLLRIKEKCATKNPRSNEEHIVNFYMDPEEIDKRGGKKKKQG